MNKIIEMLLNPVTQHQLSLEQTIEQNLWFPAYVIKTTEGFNAAVSVKDNMFLANVPMTHIEKEFKKLTVMEGLPKNSEYSGMRYVDTRKASGFVRENGGNCVVQLTLLH